MAIRNIAASRRAPFTLTLAAMLVLGLSTACAFEVQTGNPDLSLRWGNTLKYSFAWFVQNMYAGKGSQYSFVDRFKTSEFLPAAMAGRGEC
jgi:hypothetical protein